MLLKVEYFIMLSLISNTFSVYSNTFSDSIEYRHIYVSDTTKVVKIYKEAKDYVNPFGPVTYFSIQIPQRTYFSLSLCSFDSNNISVIKPIFKDILNEGNYRIEDLNLGNEYSGIYFYQIDVLDSVYYQKLLLLK